MQNKRQTNGVSELSPRVACQICQFSVDLTAQAVLTLNNTAMHSQKISRAQCGYEYIEI